MKIIQLIQKPQRRGAEIFAAQLSQQLSELGHEVLLVSLFEGKADLPFEGEFVKMNRPIGGRLFDFKGWSTFDKIIKDFSPDLIQANAADTLKFSVFSKLIFSWKTPIIYRNANQMGDFIKGSLHRKFNQFLINKVSGIISVSDASRIDFHNTFSFSKEMSVSIPIGIVHSEIEVKLKTGPEFDLPQNFIIQIGGWVLEKDPIGMICMFKEVATEFDELHLVFIGSGPLESAMKRSIRESDLSGKVHLIPNQRNIFPYLKKAKALVMPSKIEGLPAVILEAMYCEIPVVAFSVGGIKDIIGKETGWLVPSGDSEEFKKALKELLATPSTILEKLNFKALNFVKDKYSISQITKQFETFYQLAL